MPQRHSNLHETRPLIARTCVVIASVTSGFRLSFYDALYIALAEREGCDLVSGDDRLVRNMAADYSFIKSLSSI
jgi:predicted nucleic acid-binding protein